MLSGAISSASVYPVRATALRNRRRIRRTAGDSRSSPGRALLSNSALAQRFERNLQALGRTTRPRDELSGAWSGDTSNVSWFVPTIQPQMAMTARDAGSPMRLLTVPFTFTPVRASDGVSGAAQTVTAVAA